MKNLTRLSILFFCIAAVSTTGWAAKGADQFPLPNRLKRALSKANKRLARLSKAKQKPGWEQRERKAVKREKAARKLVGTVNEQLAKHSDSITTLMGMMSSDNIAAGRVPTLGIALQYADVPVLEVVEDHDDYRQANVGNVGVLGPPPSPKKVMGRIAKALARKVEKSFEMPKNSVPRVPVRNLRPLIEAAKAGKIAYEKEIKQRIAAATPVAEGINALLTSPDGIETLTTAMTLLGTDTITLAKGPHSRTLRIRYSKGSFEAGVAHYFSRTMDAETIATFFGKEIPKLENIYERLAHMLEKSPAKK